MKLFLCVLGLFIMMSTASAEVTVRQAGDRSINFSVVGSELIDEYKFGFGGKYWATSSIAFSGSFDISNNDRETSYAPDGSISKGTNRYYALSLAVEKHFQAAYKLSPYFGGELKYARFNDDYSTVYAYSSSVYQNTDKGKQYGAALLVGAEYAINKNLSLAGEYAFGYNYRKSKYTYDYGSGSVNEQTFTSKGFDLSVGRLTLLLYF